MEIIILAYVLEWNYDFDAAKLRKINELYKYFYEKIVLLEFFIRLYNNIKGSHMTAFDAIIS